MGRVRSRIEKLEERHGDRRARRSERDEREEEHRAVMHEMSKTAEGREAIARFGELHIEGGGNAEVFRSEGGREAARSFRDAFFEAAEKVRNEREAKLGGNG